MSVVGAGSDSERQLYIIASKHSSSPFLSEELPLLENKTAVYGSITLNMAILSDLRS